MPLKAPFPRLLVCTLSASPTTHPLHPHARLVWWMVGRVRALVFTHPRCFPASCPFPALSHPTPLTRTHVQPHTSLPPQLACGADRLSRAVAAVTSAFDAADALVTTCPAPLPDVKAALANAASTSAAAASLLDALATVDSVFLTSPAVSGAMAPALLALAAQLRRTVASPSALAVAVGTGPPCKAPTRPAPLAGEGEAAPEVDAEDDHKGDVAGAELGGQWSEGPPPSFRKCRRVCFVPPHTHLSQHGTGTKMRWRSWRSSRRDGRRAWTVCEQR